MSSESKNECLICGKQGRLTRGLCNTHYAEYNRAKKEFTTDQQQNAFEDLCIKEKRVLPSMHSGRRKQGGFGDLVAKIEKQFANEEADAIAEEIQQAITKPSIKSRKKKAQ